MKHRLLFTLSLILFLPSCIFKKSTRTYDCARAAYENVLYKYDREAAIFEAMQKAGNREDRLRFARELKDEVLLKNEEFNDEKKGWFNRQSKIANYPFTQYKMNLDANINLLENSKHKLYWKQEGLGKSVQNLINVLDNLRRHIVLHVEYSRERKMLERRKILEVEKAETKKDKIKAKKAKNK
jgi:hypothetical protein